MITAADNGLSEEPEPEEERRELGPEVGGDQEAGDRGQQGGGGKEVSLWKKSRNFSSN